MFEHVKGVVKVTSGYAGGRESTAHYYVVGTGMTGHAESVEIVFDPRAVSYETLLHVFFMVAHDPTQLNRQGPDVGTQYRSAIFYGNAEQRRVAQAVMDSLNQARAFRDPIVTQVTPLTGFYAAEDYHQDYAILHPDEAYIVYNHRPKVGHLREHFPALFNEAPVRNPVSTR